MIIGGYLSCKMTSVRIALGAWCLLTFVLLNVYNGVLTSYLLATQSAEPLINSMDDVVTMPNIKLVVHRGRGPDFIFSVRIQIMNTRCETFHFIWLLTVKVLIMIPFRGLRKDGTRRWATNCDPIQSRGAIPPRNASIWWNRGLLNTFTST
jgi:hypothetical protein